MKRREEKVEEKKVSEDAARSLRQTPRERERERERSLSFRKRRLACSSKTQNDLDRRHSSTFIFSEVPRGVNETKRNERQKFLLKRSPFFVFISAREREREEEEEDQLTDDFFLGFFFFSRVEEKRKCFCVFLFLFFYCFTCQDEFASE